MSGKATILVVEDNPTTLRMQRLVLQNEGYVVIEAADARAALTAAGRALPDLVLQDLVLPDMDGLELLRLLRALPGGREMPIIAVSGFLSRVEEARAIGADFTALLIKPLEPHRLVEAIRLYLPPPVERPTAGRQQGHLLVVDDDPVQLKLTRLFFSETGFDVTAAASGSEALRLAHANPPDVILSDVFMAETDGFDLCQNFRRDAALSRVPIVLISARYWSAADRELARRVGANALVLWTPDFDEALAAINEARRTGPVVAVEPPSDALQLSHARQVIQQLERQVAVTSGFMQRCSLQATQLSLLSGVADALTGRRDVDAALEEILAATLDAAGISKGALLLKELDGPLRLRQAVGFSDAEREALATFFGHLNVLDDIVREGASVGIPSPALPEDTSRAILKGASVASAQIVPLISDGRGVGAMIIGANRRDVTTDDSAVFARAMGNHVVQSLELTKAVARLSAAEQRYRTLLESASEAIAVLTRSGVVREINHRWAQILGRPAEELIGHDIREFAPASRRHDYGRIVNEAIAGAVSPVPVEIVRPNGSTVLMEFSSTPVDVAGERLVFVIGRDVTEQRLLEEQLRQAQKLEGIGQLAGGIAHDFNNILTVILGFGDLVTTGLPADSPEQASVLEIKKAALRAAALTQQLLAFSRKQILQPRILDVNGVIAEVEPMLRRVIAEHIVLSVSLSPDVGRIRMDPTQIDQILINLAVNAADAMPRGGKLKIETARINAGEDVQQYLPVAPGGCVAITVSDTGTGMDEATMRRIFEPFFTTKEVGKGTGLGLSTVHGIVKQSGGEIRVESEPGRGTTFKIYLPLVTTLASPVEASARTTRTRQGSETILLVEDDDAVRLLARTTLEREGYRVLPAGNPRDAQQIAAACTGHIDLLLSDVIMPESEGPPLFDFLAKTEPDLRRLYMSGYADDAIFRQGVLTESTPFLQKPFTPDALARKVRESLDGPSPLRSRGGV